VGGRRSVLVNFVYCHPVGHAIEALHYCHGYHRADPGLRIGLALNADTPTELAVLCPYVDDIYPVSVDVFDRAYDPASALGVIPAGWDWVVSDARGQQPPACGLSRPGPVLRSGAGSLCCQRQHCCHRRCGAALLLARLPVPPAISRRRPQPG
jgi:hypothetical protein